MESVKQVTRQGANLLGKEHAADSFGNDRNRKLRGKRSGLKKGATFCSPSPQKLESSFTQAVGTVIPSDDTTVLFH